MGDLNDRWAHVTEGGDINILLVEDNPIDVRMTLRAANSLTTPHSIDVVADGDEAIRYLSSAEHRTPHLVLLDLNLPGRDGHDVLRVVKADPDLKHIPIIVVSTSIYESDVVGAYAQGANAYVAKPSDLDMWRDTLSQIEAFWFSLVQLPTP